MVSYAVLLTTHERRDSTLACLEQVARQTRSSARLHVVLVDAGSTDGTPDAVRAAFPDVEVLDRSADLFWNAGMRVAFAHAHAQRHDAYLWLNDDTLLDEDAVGRLEATWGGKPPSESSAIVVGATRDPVTGAVTYGGVRRPDGLRRLRWDRVEPGDAPRPVETMNGNCVLVPSPVADAVGNLDPQFSHGMGDYDYGLRARRKGFAVVLAPGTVGTCEVNPRRELGTIGTSWRDAVSVKGLPPREWAAFARRWAGPAWPVYFASPYLRQAVALLGRSSGRPGD